MKSNLIFDFTVDKKSKTIYVTREFEANLDLVWKAWTDPELLDQWWAPKPYHIETKSLDFKEGGRWLYAMISPKNEKEWCKADYKKIELLKTISWLDAFCDEKGIDNSRKPKSFWNNNFTENNGTTTVNIILQHGSLDDLEMIIQMGFKEGFTMALQNLDKLLFTLNNR